MSFDARWLDECQLNALLDHIEARSPHGTLIISTPCEEHRALFEDLCRAYLEAAPRQRKVIRNAVRIRNGILNHLLGFIHETARGVRETGDVMLLRTGLAAAAIRGDGPDPRDYLLALAELYLSAEDAGLDPQAWFESAGPGVPSNFHTYAVLLRRRSETVEQDHP